MRESVSAYVSHSIVLILLFSLQVGNAFVNQYYNVLHQSPQVVHRFYTNASRLTRAEAGADGAVDTVFNQNVRNFLLLFDIRALIACCLT